MDQAAGFLKTAAKRAVITNTDMAIRNAKELYEFAETYLASREAGEIESFEIDSSVDDSQVIDTTPLDYTNLIGVDSFVAIKPSSGAIYSFFVLHVTSSGVYELEKDTRSQYSHTFG